jgi:putative membrane protein
MRLILRLLVNAAALWAATRFVPGISFDGEWQYLFLVALVFGVLNVSVRPILKVLTLPFLILTLGLFIFVLNAFMLWLTGVVSDAAGLGFHVSGFRAAFLGALVVTVVSFVLSLFVGGDGDRKERREWRQQERRERKARRG